jgi:probable rRNA maturation factor
MMEVIITNQINELKWSEYADDFMSIFEKTIRMLKKNKESNISVIFCNSSQIRIINRDYRKIDKETDVISFASQDGADNFDYLVEEVELGDIFINVDRVYTQAESYQHSIRREVCFLFTHGLLHCLGYDHMNEEDEKIMFELQNKILEGIVSRND